MNGKKLYEFGRFKLDAEERLLFDVANSIQLPPKIFDTLLMLVENAGRSVEKDAMTRQIWSDSFVEENNLAQNISILRKTLGDVGFIETVPKRGYRFAAQVRIIEDAPNRFVAERTSFRVRETNSFEEEKRRKGEEEIESIGSKDSFSPFSTALELAPAKPETRYAQNGDVNIAYQVVGNGDLDVVFVMGWVSHLEYFWEEPHFAAFLNRLASFSRLILFDKRGTGLSDRVPVNELPTLEQRSEER